MFPVTAAIKDPAVKKVTAVSNIALRPKMSLKVAKSGRKHVAAARNEIDSQKVSKAEPPNSVAMVYDCVSL